MKLREALLTQSPSLALQRAAADEIARLDDFIIEVEELIRNHTDLEVIRAFISLVAALNIPTRYDHYEF